jgi:hypothetical protein
LRSNIPFVPDRVAVLVRSRFAVSVLLQSRLWFAVSVLSAVAVAVLVRSRFAVPVLSSSQSLS